MRILFELCAKDPEILFSPWVWAVRMALKHKGLEFESSPHIFLDKASYAGSGSKTLPVLKDGDLWVTDSFKIAHYLEETYPDNPLFGGQIAQAQSGLIQSWMGRTILGALFPMIAADVCALLDEENAAYFRETRERHLGCTLEEAAAGRMDRLDDFHKSLAPMHGLLKGQEFIAGDEPAWADYVAFGAFQWCRIVSELDPLAGNYVLVNWRARMLDLFDGYGRAAKRAHA